MPGPAIHISVMRHVAKALADAGYKPEGSARIDSKRTGAGFDALWYLQDGLSPWSGDQYPQFTEVFHEVGLLFRGAR